MNVVSVLLAACGTLITGIAAMLYRRLGRIEDLMRDAIRELQKEDAVLHGRVSSLDNRVTVLETVTIERRGQPRD